MEKTELDFDSFTTLPVSQSPDNTVWILYHPTGGAYVLDAGAKHSKKGRIVALSGSNKAPKFQAWLGSTIKFPGKSRRYMSSRLPKDAPMGGPALLQAAIAALRKGYETSPLRMREGHTLEDMKKVLAALTVLARHQKLKLVFCHLPLSGKPDTPIAQIERSATENKDGEEYSILQDVIAWFGPSAKIGPDNASYLGREDGEDHAIAIFPSPWQDPSSHDLMEAAQVVTAFYQEAAPVLELTEEDLKQRFKVLGLG